MTIATLSNRADLVSGGSALVEIKTPGFVVPATLKVDRDGTDITGTFSQQASGRILGMVTGLKTGANVITAKASDGSIVGAQLVITNHPIGGPVLLSAQAGPWVCATPVPVAAGQQTGLNTVFSTGVYDWSKSGVARSIRSLRSISRPVRAAFRSRQRRPRSRFKRFSLISGHRIFPFVRFFL